VVEALAGQLARPGSADDLGFVGPQGGTLRLATFRHRIWRPATRAAGLDELRIHDLRHTAVALWIAARATPKEVAARAGHTSVSFTLDRYGHLYPDADQALRDRLDALHALSQPQQSVSLDGPETDQEGRSRPEGASQPPPHRRWPAGLAGGRDRARTCDLVVVSDALWPAELHARVVRSRW
jgi:hypothetical protein